MEKNSNIKKVIISIILIMTSIASIFFVSPKVSSPEFHSKTISKLDEKKITVMELTLAAAGTSTALAAIPGEATTPLANQIMNLSSYLLIIIGAIFLEKILLTLTGYAAFMFLIPIACLLGIMYVFLEKDILRNISIRLLIFGIVIFITIPVSVKISNMIEDTYKISANQTLEENEISEIETEENEGWLNKVKEGISNIGDKAEEAIQSGKKSLSNLIDVIAILIITSCVIPIAVLFFLIWSIKMILGVNIPIPSIKKKADNKSD